MKKVALLLGFPLLAVLLAGCPQTQPPPPPTSCPARSQTQSLATSSTSPRYKPGVLLVKLSSSKGSRAGVLSGLSLEPLTTFLKTDWFIVRVPPGQERAWLQKLSSAGVAEASLDHFYYPLRVPNDTYYVRKQRIDFNDLLHLENAWDQALGSSSLKMAVVDTGYRGHDDLLNRLDLSGSGLDVADSDDDPTDDTTSAGSHGTAVSGVLGAETNNAKGIAGVTWDGWIIPVKVFKQDTDPNNSGTDMATVARGIDKAASLGAKIINLSLGGDYYPALDDTLKAAHDAGIVLIAAAGNEGQRGLLFPASSPTTIGVGAINRERSRASFSNCGPELDLVAPGVDVYSFFDERSYGVWSGTSIAAPFVSGVAALYMSAYRDAYGDWPSPDQVYQCLTATAEDLGPAGKDDDYGFGLVRPDRVMSDTSSCFP